MVEIIISVIDRTSDDPAVDSSLPKRGVVIAAFEDGHDYGIDELTHPMFRIFKLPGLPMTVAQSLMGPEISSDPSAPNPRALARQFKLDLDAPAIPTALRQHLDDGTRKTPFVTVPPALLAALKTKRAAFVDPAVVGQPAHIIG